jgi:hypothetical protein
MLPYHGLTLPLNSGVDVSTVLMNNDRAFVTAANAALKDPSGLQGQGSGAGFPGTLTAKSTLAILGALGIGRESRLFDAGSGIGRPLVLSSVVYDVAEARGVDVDECIVMQANAFMHPAVQRLADRLKALGVEFDHAPRTPVVKKARIEELKPCEVADITHVYIFAPGMFGAHGQSIYEALFQLFSESVKLQAMAIVCHSTRDIVADLEEDGWIWPDRQLVLKKCIASVKQMGSNATYKAYVVTLERV